MEIFGFKISREKKQEERSESVNDVLSLLFAQGTNNISAMQLSTVYRCTDLISNTVALMDLQLMKDAGGHLIPDKQHPIYFTFSKQPNRYMTRFTFMKAIVVNMLLKGNAYCYVNRDSKGNADSVSLLDFNDVNVDVNEQNNTVNYFYKGKLLPYENVIHIKNMSYDGITGVSTITAATNTLSTAGAAENHSNKFFKEGANIQGIVTTVNKMTAAQMEEFKQSWRTAYGDSKTGGMAFISGGVDVKPVSVSPSDAQLLETRQFNVIEICRFFGVSPIMAFDLTKAGYNNSETASLTFLQETIQPIIEKIELEFWKTVLKPSEKEHYEFKFNTNDFLKVDKTTTASYYSQLFQMGVMTTNEVRGKLGLPAVEGGDKVFIQSNVVPNNYFERNELKQDNILKMQEN